MEATDRRGALGAVLAKLKSLLADDFTPGLDERRRGDMEFIILELQPVLSVLEKTWDYEGFWTAEARKVPYKIKGKIDELVLGMAHGGGINLLEGIKLQVQWLVICLFQIFERMVLEIREDVIDNEEATTTAGTTVSAATGALGPVLVKLKSLLVADASWTGLEETSRGDIEFIILGLQPVHSLLESAWEREDVVEGMKDWMAEARELSFEIKAKFGELVPHGVGTINISLLEGIKLQVQGLVCRFFEFIFHEDDESEAPSERDISTQIEAGTVSAATGALGPVLAKLKSLLLVADEGTPGLEAESRRGDIEFIISKLEPVHSLLERIWEREDDLDAACKDWTVEARDMSYGIEDNIDDFVLGGAMGHGGPTFTSLIAGIKQQVQGLVDRPCWEELSQTITTSNNRSSEPAALVGARCYLHKDESSELVEMEGKKAELTKLLQDHGAVCILGFAGMGKTTLADLVYQAIRERFECHAFVLWQLFSPN
nr:unnamed protein product [Digitaria exilis]